MSLECVAFIAGVLVVSSLQRCTPPSGGCVIPEVDRNAYGDGEEVVVHAFSRAAADGDCVVASRDACTAGSWGGGSLIEEVPLKASSKLREIKSCCCGKNRARGLFGVGRFRGLRLGKTAGTIGMG